MNDMNRKMLYIWRLATFLRSNDKEMSAPELVDHRNGFTTQRGTAHEKGGHGPYRIISATWHWINDELGLPHEAENVALAYVKPDGTHVWEIYDEVEAATN